MAIRGKSRTRIVAVLFAAFGLTNFPGGDEADAASSVGRVDPDAFSCPFPGFIDFESLPDRTDLTAQALAGVQFTTTDGYTWQVGDFSTNQYNGKYPSGQYTSRGTHWAWLGENYGRGRIDFPGGRVSYISLLVSSQTPVSLEAYDANDVLLEVAGPSTVNTSTGQMDELRISRTRADIHHVVVHDSGNFFLVDGICTDARGVDGDPTVRQQWVQLGDSFSAGVGLGKVTAGCDQDSGAFTPVAYADLNKTKTVLSDVLINASCTGATTADYWASQAQFVGRDADIATMTFGGNDAFLAAKVFGCYIGRCGPDVFGVEAGTENQKVTWDEIFSRLVDVYFDVRTRMSPIGHLYVLTYPIPFGLGSGNDCNGFDQDEQLAANAFATRLGDTVFQAVQAANNLLAQSGRVGNVHFLDWRTGTRMENHYTVPAGFPHAGEKYPVVISPNGLCSREGRSFLNDFVRHATFSPDRNNSFHPNRVGYGFAAQLLKDAVVTDFR